MRKTREAAKTRSTVKTHMPARPSQGCQAGTPTGRLWRSNLRAGVMIQMRIMA